MHPRAAQLVDTLGMEPHPEGGHFVQTFRSERTVVPADGRGPRAALTLIYFLLTEGSCSRWHRVRSDEAWHWYEGDPVELLVAPPGGAAVDRWTLGPLSPSSAPARVVPAEWWQAARPLGRYALTGCSVGPGFDYSDFVLLSSLPAAERPAFDPGTLL